MSAPAKASDRGARRIFNFSAGPAVLPVPVLEEARDALLSLGDTGIGILEHSHRGKAFLEVYEETVSLVRAVGGRAGRATTCCSCRAARRRSSSWCP